MTPERLDQQYVSPSLLRMWADGVLTGHPSLTPERIAGALLTAADKVEGVEDARYAFWLGKEAA